jgi:putative ABC transport system substrate-binding protein
VLYLVSSHDTRSSSSGANVRRRDFLLGLAIGSAARPATAQPKSVRIIGILHLGTETLATGDTAALRQGLIGRGYAEERDFRLEIRFANNDASRLKALVKDLLAHGAEVIVTSGTSSARAAHAETRRVPIVLAGSADPVEMGFAETLARPGGNVTGLSIHGTDMVAKLLELLRDAIPGMKAAGALLHAANPGVAKFRQSLERTAISLGLELRVLEVRRPDEIEPTFARFAALGAQALFVIPDPVFRSMADLLARLGIKHRLPIVTGMRDLVRVGGFASYGVDARELWRRAADFVDRIFRGTVPAEMPIEQPTKFELVINLKTAKALGLTIPPTLLVRADEVIE